MWHAVPYTQIDVNPPPPGFPVAYKAHRPIVRLQLNSGSQKLACYAIVDSGADHCVFPMSFALQLGLNPLGQASAQTSGVGGGGIEMFYWDVQIEFPGVTKIDLRAGFTVGMESQGIGLLGQNGFFERYKVLFDLPSGRFHIEVP